MAGSAFAKESIFSTAYKAEKENNIKYYQDATKGISKKFNTAVQKSGDTAILSLVNKCRGGDLFTSELDASSANILPGLRSGANNSFSHVQIASSLNPRVWLLTTEEGAALDRLMLPSLLSVKEQADFLISTQKDLDSPGRYMDGDTKNSPFDLVDDVQKILGLFMKDPPQFGGSANTMKNDAPGLITGRFETGSWAQWKQYEVDLVSDIAWALGQKKDGSSGGDSGSGSDCEDGFCITLDIITNDSYSADSRGGGTAFINTNFQEIFGSALDWLIKKWDKRNLACKAPPPVNHFQSNNDMNLSFSKIFRGLGIFVFKKTPPYAKTSTSKAKKEKTALQKEKDTDDVINNSLKNYNVDKEHLMLGTIWQSVEWAAPQAPTYLETAQNREKALRQYNDYQKAKQNAWSIERKATGSRVNEVAKNSGRMVESWMSSLGTTIKDLLDISKAWKSKPPCKN